MHPLVLSFVQRHPGAEAAGAEQEQAVAEWQEVDDDVGLTGLSPTIALAAIVGVGHHFNECPAREIGFDIGLVLNEHLAAIILETNPVDAVFLLLHRGWQQSVQLREIAVEHLSADRAHPELFPEAVGHGSSVLIGAPVHTAQAGPT